MDTEAKFEGQKTLGNTCFDISEIPVLRGLHLQFGKLIDLIHFISFLVQVIPFV